MTGVSSTGITSAAIKARARELGFTLCRILPVGSAPHGDFFRAWLQRGNAGDMRYLGDYLDRRLAPARLAAKAGPVFHSLVVLGVDYFQFQLDAATLADPARGIIASYAWGLDYHAIIKPLLFDLDGFIRAATGRTAYAKCLVDTGPVLERDWAHRAGLGFVGKNCCVIHPTLGSWLLLATMVVPEALEADPAVEIETDDDVEALIAGAPRDAHFGFWTVASEEGPSESVAGESVAGESGTCGRCDRCLTACPTDAFVGPFHLDARRCISYWTIETRAPIPSALRAQFGNRIFGCDICQEACPWNARRREPQAPRLPGLRAREDRVAPPLVEGFASSSPYWLEDAAFEQRFGGSPVMRATRIGMLRNVCVALGNWGSPEALDPLRLALRDEAAVVRGHAAWAVERIGARADTAAATKLDAEMLLLDALRAEHDDYARGEMTDAQARLTRLRA